jgi:spore maturation protein CgeB
MRTFEVPAMRGCFLPERTADHVALFGAEGEAVRYFDGPADLVSQVRRLLANADERERLAARAHRVITSGRHTYADRLAAMLDAA